MTVSNINAPPTLTYQRAVADPAARPGAASNLAVGVLKAPSEPAASPPKVTQGAPLLTGKGSFMLGWIRENFQNEKTYAEVVKDGKIVATLDNGGGMTSSMPGLFDILRDDDKLNGPAAAQRRAEQIAEAIGGKVIKASTAMSPAEWRPQLNMTAKEKADSFAAYVARQMELASHSAPTSMLNI